MLDSGANARVTYARHLDKTQSVGSVTLASGQTAPCSSYIGRKGMPSIEIVGSSDTDILPLFWLIERNCAMASDFMTLFTPKGRILQVLKGDDELLYLDAKSVEQLFADLPEPEEFGRSGAPASLMINAAFSMRLQIAAVRVESNLSEAGVTHVGHAGLGESVLGDIGNAGATDMGHAGRETHFAKSLRKRCSPVALTFCLKTCRHLQQPLV